MRRLGMTALFAALGLAVISNAAFAQSESADEAAPARGGYQSSFVIRYDRWTDRDEKDFGEFVRAIGESGCHSVDECLRSTGNPFHASDKPGVRFTSDCANLPYVLRAYFAWKRGLPFSYVSAVSARGTSSDNRYSPNGNQANHRQDVLSGSTTGYALLQRLLADTSSADYRIHPHIETPLEPDFYSAAINARAIHPGTIIYDPDGHVAVVFDVGSDGRIQFMDAHPDNLLSRGYYDLRFVRGLPGAGAGFKNWRPIALEGYSRRGDGALIGGHVVASTNAEIADYSDEQFYGNGTHPGDADWANGMFSLNGETLDYYDYVRAKLAGGKLAFDPVKELTSMVNSNCADLHDRVLAVDLGVAAGMPNRAEPERLPRNIYGTEGDWETYSTPSRDARLKTAFKETRDQTQRFVEMYKNGDRHLVYAGKNLVGDLTDTYDRQTASCTIGYTRTDGSRVSLSYEDARKRLFLLSFDPYQCIERRWGASDPNELSTCRDGDNKKAWYRAQQNLRNQIDRDYSARMDFALNELGEPGPGKGVAQPPDTDVRGYLASLGIVAAGTVSTAAVAADDPMHPAPVVPPSASQIAAISSARAAEFAQWQSSHPYGALWDAAVAPRLKVIPAGTFQMGSPSWEAARWRWEGPVHNVSIRHAFAIAEFPVTFDEWDMCVADGGCNGYWPNDEHWGRGNRPVINVSWADAQAYVRWLSAKTGKTYRLLSESEWEYAARAGTSTPYYFGNAISRDQANYFAGDDPDPGGKTPTTMTQPVDKSAPNGFGLHDMNGNVWEWVSDCWHEGYAGAPDDGSAWSGGDCQRHVVRGGAFNRDATFLRSAFRYWIVGDLRTVVAGFRVARDLQDER